MLTYRLDIDDPDGHPVSLELKVHRGAEGIEVALNQHPVGWLSVDEATLLASCLSMAVDVIQEGQ